MLFLNSDYFSQLLLTADPLFHCTCLLQNIREKEKRHFYWVGKKMSVFYCCFKEEGFVIQKENTWIFSPKTWCLKWAWCHMPLVSALGKERQLSLHESEVILVYIVSFPTVKVVTQRKEKPCLEGTHTQTHIHTKKKPSKQQWCYLYLRQVIKSFCLVHLVRPANANVFILPTQ